MTAPPDPLRPDRRFPSRTMTAGIRHVFIDRSVADEPLTRLLRDRLDIPAEVVDDARAVYRRVNAADDPVAEGKRVLFITRNRGAFLRECPGTSHYLCCGYMILHVGTFCGMDCSYCILQSYFHPPVLQAFVNHGDMLRELETAFATAPYRRVGTGEFTDSLIWEALMPLSDVLVPAFARQSRMMLELKTKTTTIARLRNLDHRRKTAVAWSVNTEAVIAMNERHTAPLEARLRAAAACESWGYPLAFHFDPLVLYDGCEADYESVVRRIFERVSPANVLWVSIGSFRFMPDLKPLVQRRFPDSKIVYGEFISGGDDKMRYFKPLRVALYRRVDEALHRAAPETPVYFCMEDEDVWRRVFGFSPEERGGLPAMLDASATRICGLEKRAAPREEVS